MRRLIGPPTVLGSLLLVLGCGGGLSGMGSAGECTVTDDTLNGTVWFEWELMADHTFRRNHMTRMKWFQEDGIQKIKYTAKSPIEVHTYACAKRDDKDGEFKEWACLGDANFEEWCLALESHELGSCTVAKLKEFGATGSDEDLKSAVKKATSEAKEMSGKDKDTRARWKASKNNRGNVLQMRLDAHMDTSKCQLIVTDKYMTIFGGKMQIKSNPVGTNPFVLPKEENLEWSWDRCEEGGNSYPDLTTAEVPLDNGKNPQIPAKEGRQYGQTVYYHYVGDHGKNAAKDCTYSMDVWRMWQPVEKNVPVQPLPDGTLRWTYSHAWKPEELGDPPFRKWNITSGASWVQVARYKQCGDEPKEKIKTTCGTSWMLPVATGEGQ